MAHDASNQVAKPVILNVGAEIALHAARGVIEVYFEGDYPVMVMKSAVDQPDAPKGKFLKSASYSQPVFHAVT